MVADLTVAVERTEDERRVATSVSFPAPNEVSVLPPNRRVIKPRAPSVSSPSGGWRRGGERPVACVRRSAQSEDHQGQHLPPAKPQSAFQPEQHGGHNR